VDYAVQEVPVEKRDGAMHTTNVRELKKNPSLALRRAREGPVLILKGNEPDALLIHLDKSLTDTEAGMRPALAASLYSGGTVSLGKAAKISGLSLSEFVQHLGSLGIEIVRQDETTNNETPDVSAWLVS
jgi:predicted HTH domain antitoxin